MERASDETGHRVTCCTAERPICQHCYSTSHSISMRTVVVATYVIYKTTASVLKPSHAVQQRACEQERKAGHVLLALHGKPSHRGNYGRGSDHNHKRKTTSAGREVYYNKEERHSACCHHGEEKNDGDNLILGGIWERLQSQWLAVVYLGVVLMWKKEKERVLALEMTSDLLLVYAVVCSDLTPKLHLELCQFRKAKAGQRGRNETKTSNKEVEVWV